MIATLLIVLAFVAIVFCGLHIATRARDTFGLLLASGLTLLIGLQAAINIGVVTSALPNKGLPLPFISYGGSNLLAMLTSVGLLLSVARQARVPERIPADAFGTEEPQTVTFQPAPTIAIACGGTGGHLFPGLAVAEQLVRRGCKPVLLVSPKDVDQQAVKSAADVDIVTLPAVGLSRGHATAFVWGFIRSYRAASIHFKTNPPRAALAMGGFTAPPPILAAKRLRARNSSMNPTPSPAGQTDGAPVSWLRRLSDSASRRRLRTRWCCSPALRSDASFSPVTPTPAGWRWGWILRAPSLVMGGSQGASGINELVTGALPLFRQRAPELQLLHLAGPSDSGKIIATCHSLGLKAVVHSFLSEMELALGAATVAVSRAGAFPRRTRRHAPACRPGPLPGRDG